MPFKTQNPHLGPGGKVETFNESAWPNDRSQLGYVFEKNTKRWQMVKIVDAANAAIGDVLYWKDKSKYEATPTIGNSSASEVAGVAEVVASAANTYLWVRQGGAMDVKSETSLDGRGDIAFGHTANNALAGANASATAGTGVAMPLVGVALGARASGKTSVDLQILPA